jgi:hypothetical protein
LYSFIPVELLAALGMNQVKDYKFVLVRNSSTNQCRVS